MIRDSTIDEREVAFYSALAETWWDREGPFWPLHKLNELRVAYIRRQLCEHFGRNPDDTSPLAGLRIIDVGCGGGILSESMSALGASVTGIDVVEKNVAVARLHSSRYGHEIDYRHGTVAAVANAGESFDVVLNMEVVEHVADVETFMHDCARVTAAGGMMFVATINRTAVAWLFAIVGAEYVLRWLPRGTHRWGMFRKPGEIAELLHAEEFVVTDSAGVAVNPLTHRFRPTKTLNVNYMLTAARRE